MRSCLAASPAEAEDCCASSCCAHSVALASIFEASSALHSASLNETPVRAVPVLGWSNTSSSSPPVRPHSATCWGDGRPMVTPRGLRPNLLMQHLQRVFSPTSPLPLARKPSLEGPPLRSSLSSSKKQQTVQQLHGEPWPRLMPNARASRTPKLPPSHTANGRSLLICSSSAASGWLQAASAALASSGSGPKKDLRHMWQLPWWSLAASAAWSGAPRRAKSWSGSQRRKEEICVEASGEESIASVYLPRVGLRVMGVGGGEQGTKRRAAPPQPWGR